MLRAVSRRMLSTMATPNSASKTPRYGQRQTLVLNADYTPLSVTTAVRALMLEVSNKATVLETSTVSKRFQSPFLSR